MASDTSDKTPQKSTPSGGEGERAAPKGAKPIENKGGETKGPETITLTKDQLQELLTAHKEDILKEIAAGGKVRQVDERDTSRAETLANQALARTALDAPDDGKLPEGCVRFLPMKAFHIARKDIPGHVDSEGASVEVIPDPERPPIVLRKGLAESLQARKFGRIV